MDETTLETLEYPLVLAELASFTATPYGSERALSLRPLGDASQVETAYAELRELLTLHASSVKLPLNDLVDIRPVLAKTGTVGACLVAEDFIELKAHLSQFSALKKVADLKDFQKNYPLIKKMVDALTDQSFLTSEFKRIFDDKGAVSDKASGELKRIRRSLRDLRSTARSTLEEMIRSKKLSEHLQEDFFSIRDDRYVLAVKASEQSSVEGVIHGRSATEATFFIEPLRLVEHNNRLQILKKEENAEIIRILRELTGLVNEERENILADVKVLASFDLLNAKALFTLRLSCVIPELTTEGIELKNARHPLLALAEATGGASAVPIDIMLGREHSVLVISGANTGGKTVALKTLGLLTLMAHSALPIPANEGSLVRLFSSVFADIGDRQAITESLSTFSGHIARLKEFLELATEDSLLLLDEIGSGTDPAEGGAFALAILDELTSRGAKVAVTTHLNLLKAHAATNPAYLNASVIFDDKTLKPSYDLSYGNPGASLGISIAEKLGIPERVITKARAGLSGEEGAFISSLTELSEETERLKELNERLASLATARDEAVEGLRAKRKEIIEKIRARLNASAIKAEAEIRETVKRLKELEREGGLISGDSSRAAKSARADIKTAVTDTLPEVAEEAQVYIPSEGDHVEIKGTRTRAVVTRVDIADKEAELKAGKLKIRSAFDRLKKVEGGGSPRVRADDTGGYDIDARKSINLLGMRVEEALSEVERFLDDAHAGGLDRVEIIHGIGTGALSMAIAENLKENRIVKNFYKARPEAGGAGVTVCELA